MSDTDSVKTFFQAKDMRLAKSAQGIVTAAYSEANQIPESSMGALAEAIASIDERWADEAIVEKFDEIIALVASNHETGGLLDDKDRAALTFASAYAKTIESMAAIVLFSTFGHNLEDAMGRRSLATNPFFDANQHATAEVSQKILSERILLLKRIGYITSVFSFAAKARRLLPEISVLCSQFIRREKTDDE